MAFCHSIRVADQNTFKFIPARCRLRQGRLGGVTRSEHAVEVL
jgi:hypothetical protein